VISFSHSIAELRAFSGIDIGLIILKLKANICALRGTTVWKKSPFTSWVWASISLVNFSLSFFFDDAWKTDTRLEHKYIRHKRFDQSVLPFHEMEIFDQLILLCIMRYAKVCVLVYMRHDKWKWVTWGIV